MAAAADDDVNALFAAHRTQLLRYIRKFVGDDEAQDVLQDVFLSFLKQKRASKIRAMDERAWLYRACHNRAIDYIRRNRKLRRFSEEKLDRFKAPAEAPMSRAWQELREKLHALALGFDKKGQGALLLHLLEEGTPKSLIAETLNISDRNLRRKVAQLFQYLQQELRKRGIEKLDLDGW
jgi:RNA polymerase sigma-70 factor (ECF subfamily)